MATRRRSTRATIRQPAIPELLPNARRKRELARIEESLLAAGVPTPEVEYRFATQVGREWRFDYAWPAQKVAYEREGGTWGKVVVDAAGKKYRTVAGRHASGAGMDKDAEKYNAAGRLGWIVVRGTASTERSGQAIRDLELALITRGWRRRE